MYEQLSLLPTHDTSDHDLPATALGHVSSQECASPLIAIASGSNHAGEIRGFVDAGMHVGVSVNRVNAQAARALCALAGTSTRVFIDSGAFSEVAFTQQGPAIVQPIDDTSWRKRLALALDIARSLGKQALVVAPDRVGCQDTTLQRLSTYRDQVNAIAATGAEVLIPLQRGPLPLEHFLAEAQRRLGCPVIPALPMKKAATSLHDLRAFLRAVAPRRLHLLGIGPTSPRMAAVWCMIRVESPSTITSCDSVRITAAVGRGTTHAEIRPLTKATDDAKDVIAEDMFDAHRGDDGALDYTEAIGDPSSWMTPKQARAFAKAAQEVFTSSLRVTVPAIAHDVTAWCRQDPTRFEAMASDLQTAWSEHYTRATVAERKRRSIGRHFSRRHRSLPHIRSGAGSPWPPPSSPASLSSSDR
jgi:hypothetical protein